MIYTREEDTAIDVHVQVCTNDVNVGVVSSLCSWPPRVIKKRVRGKIRNLQTQEFFKELYPPYD